MTPVVSVGLPVFNGAAHLREALDCLLHQTFSDVEIIISDNASTDATAEICQEYVAADSRVRYFRQEHNMGAFSNFDFVLTRATGQYFMWAACDDWWAPSCIEQLLKLHQDGGPDVVLSFCDVGHFGDAAQDQPKSLRLHLLQPTEGSASESLARFIQLGTGDESENLIYGLVRTDIARAADVVRRWQGFGPTCDYFMVANLLRYGNVAIHGEILWKKRIHGGSETARLALTERRNPRLSLKGVARTFRYGVRFTRAVWVVLGSVEGAPRFPITQRLLLTVLVGERRAVHFVRCCVAGVRRRIGALVSKAA
jgi:hypothetical protein